MLGEAWKLEFEGIIGAGVETGWRKQRVGLGASIGRGC